MSIAESWGFPLLLNLGVCVSVLQSARTNLTSVGDDGHGHGLPYEDLEFINKYLHFVNAVPSKAIIPTFVIFSIVGLFGNVCFLYFFGSMSSRMYNTRDAIYIHRMSIVDLLICVIILPYTIFYEIRLVKIEVLCKVMEYNRHFLVIMSHLFLASYAFEYSKKDNYYMAKKRLDRATKVIAVFSMLACIPILFIFEVNSQNNQDRLRQDNDSQVQPNVLQASQVDIKAVATYISQGYHPTNKYIYSNPITFCHMSLNMNQDADIFALKRTLKIVYDFTLGFVFFVYIATITYNFIQFMDSRPLLGRKSVFVHTIALSNPEITLILSDLKRQKLERKQKSAMALNEMNDSYMTIRRQESKQNPGDTQAGKPTQSGTIEEGNQFDGKRTNYQSSVEVKGQASMSASARLTGTSRDLRESESSDVDHIKHYGTTQQQIPEDEILEIFTHQGEHMLPSDIEDGSEIPLIKFLCGCECCKSQPRGIRKLDSFYPRLPKSSYKRTLMWLSLFDTLFITASIVAFLISEEKSVMLNLVHFKSVFSFYILSLMREEVRRATWGDSSCGIGCLCAYLRSGSTHNNKADSRNRKQSHQFKKLSSSTVLKTAGP